MKTQFIILLGVLGMTLLPEVAMADNLVVLELFTSQGCSSCPPADQLLKKISLNDPSLLPLSFHVHYWDYLGWKDPFSSPTNTERQRNYASVLDGQVYTPELVVNGEKGVVGSDEVSVNNAIAMARETKPEANVTISQTENGKLDVFIRPVSGTHPTRADIWEIHFAPYSRTQVANGENDGRMLENINSVRRITKLSVWDGQSAHYTIPRPNDDDGIAVLIQNSNAGRILGVGSYKGPN